MIGCDGNVTQRKLGDSRVHLRGVRQNHTSLSVVFSAVNLNRSEKGPCLSVSLPVCQTKDWVVSPVTDEAQTAFNDLTTVTLLQQELL